LAVLERARRGRAEHGEDRFDLVGRGAKLAQDRADGFAVLGGDETLAPVGAAAGLAGGLGKQRDVLGDDAGFEPKSAVGSPSAA